MIDSNNENPAHALGKIIRDVAGEIAFTIIEVGALPLEGSVEIFHSLLDVFPQSRIIAFEVDEDLCEKLNKEAKPGLRYYPVALGRTEETRKFYETKHSMCCSLYEPNEALIGMYNNMDVAMLKSVEEIQTVSLDAFARENDIGSVDFIKIDVQGAELDVFEGAKETLKDVTTIVSEVEFVPHYIDQPLFGDVCAFLAQRGFMFHKFLMLAGRSLKPIYVNNNANFATQHIWSDAVFIRHPFKIAELPSDKLLKMGVLTFMYGSPDVAFQCFKHYDDKHGTDIHKRMFDLK